MAKEIKFDMEARDQLKSGIDQLGNAVKSIISHRAKAMRKFLKKFLTRKATA